MNDFISRLRKSLAENTDEKTKGNAQNFFKETIKFYGIKVTTVHKIGKEYYNEIKHLAKNEIFALCEQLWQSGYTEESYIACDWSYYVHKDYKPEDFEVFERWVAEYVNNWSSCDAFCNHTVGEFVEMYPQYVQRLKQWTVSDNRWVRRAAAVTLILPARKGMFLDDIFEIADTLLTDTDDLVQKGYGWMLKAASQAHLQPVYNYVISKKAVMPRTAYRYAIEKMPPEMRAEAIKK